LVFAMVEGGHAPNVIPTQVRIAGTFRTLHREVWEAAREVITSTLHEVLAPYPITIEVNYDSGPPPVVNDSSVTDVVARATASALGPQAVIEAEPSLGGEDFSFYLDHVKGSYCRLGVTSPDATQTPAALHTSMFDIDERALAVGVRTLVYAVLEAQKPQ
jgi:amidohydrolase